jgi:hypothetical protein
METKKSIVKRIIIALAVIILVLLIVGIAGFKLYGNRLVKFAVETGGAQALKVNVALEEARLQLLRGELELDNLVVDNPEGYTNPHLLNMGRAHIALNTSSLMSDTVEIDKMEFKSVALVIEQKGLSSNLQEIINNLPKSEAPAPKEETAGKNLLIRDLRVEEVAVTFKPLPLPGKAGNVTFKLAPIHLTDIGTKEKIGIAQFTGLILQQITMGVVENGKGLIPTEMIGDLSGELMKQGQQILEGGQKVLEETGKGLLEGGKGVLEEGGKAVEGLKGLLPQKKEK